MKKERPLTRGQLLRFLSFHGACPEGMARAKASKAATARGVYMSSTVKGSDIWYLGDLCCLLTGRASCIAALKAATARRRWPWAELEPLIRAGLRAANREPYWKVGASDAAIRDLLTSGASS